MARDRLGGRLREDHAFKLGLDAIELTFKQLIPHLGEPVAVQGGRSPVGVPSQHSDSPRRTTLLAVHGGRVAYAGETTGAVR